MKEMFDSFSLKDFSVLLLFFLHWVVITVLAFRCRKYQLLSGKDGLTGVLNHRAIESVANTKISRVKRYENYSLFFLFIDVDDFKQVNEKRGHRIGDGLLRDITEIMVKNTRNSDIIGRWGGDEFLLILSEIYLSGAKAVAEKIINAVNDLSRENDLGIGVTIGICEFNASSAEKDPIGASNETMREAKKSGKNQFFVYGSDNS